VAQITSHARPSAPVTKNALRQPYAAAIGTIRIGVTIAPIVPPANAVAMPRARKCEGSDSTAVRRPPGNVAPSPSPSTARAAAKP